MLRIGITGCEGLLGYHLRAYLHAYKEISTRLANRATFLDPIALREFAADCDAIVHFAGVNRGDDTELERTNIALAKALVEACDAADATPHLVFSSSTHIDRATAYGRAKRQCGKIFEKWSVRSGALFSNLVLPHVFGEFGRPFYNSAVSTFCHHLAKGETPTVINDGDLELMHAQAVAVLVLDTIVERKSGELRPAGSKIRVTELLGRLQRMDAGYRNNVLPELGNDLDLRLFNVYRTWLYPDYYPVRLEQHEDTRGAFFETVRALGRGQTSISTSHPGITRGNHYHTRKLERFMVISGEGVIRLRRLFRADIVEFRVSGDQPCYIDMPTFHTHSITNVGTGTLTTMFLSSEFFDQSDSDTFSEAVVLS